MKTIKIGSKEFDLCESNLDLPTKRFLHFKEYLIMQQTGVHTPDLVKTLNGFVEGFDEGSKSKMFIALYNYTTGLQAALDKKDFAQLLFAVITFDDTEDRNNFDESKAQKKLDMWANDGLTQGIVEQCVTDFIKASPLSSILSLLEGSEMLSRLNSQE